MARVSRAVHIAAPRDRVFALIADPARIAEMDSRIAHVHVERDAHGPQRVRLEFVVKVRGAAPAARGGSAPAAPDGAAPAEWSKSAEIVADVIRYNPGYDFAVATPPGAAGSVFRLDASCRDADRGGTDLTCEVEIRLPGLGGRLADPLLGAALSRQVDVLLARVKREAAAPST